MSKDNTALLVIGAAVAGYFLAPKEIKDKITGGAAPSITSIDLGGLTSGLPTGVEDIGSKIQAGLFQLQLEGMKGLFDLQFQGLKNMVTNLPQPQQLISGITGGGGGGFPTLPEIIDAVTGNLPTPDFPGLPDWGKDEGGSPEPGKVEGIGFGEGFKDLIENVSLFEFIFGTDIGETPFIEGIIGNPFGIFGKDGREDNPEANQQLPGLPQLSDMPRSIGVVKEGLRTSYFLPSGAETTWDIANALRGKGYELIEIEAPVASEAPTKSEAGIDSYSPSAADYSNPSSPSYGASM